MIRGGDGGGPSRHAGVAANSPDDGEACTSCGSGGALHTVQGLARDAVVALTFVRGMSAWPRPRVDRQDGFQASWTTFHKTLCASKNGF